MPKAILQKKIGVIGAGIGGLSVACRLAKDGHEVHLYEKNVQVGGKLNEWSANGYRFDTGPSLLTMTHVLDELFTYCKENRQDYLNYIPISPLCRYFWKDGTQFDSYSENEKALSEIKKIAPEDEQSYNEFLEYSKNIYNKTSAAFLESPLYEWLDLKNLKLTDVFKIDALQSMANAIDKRFKSPYLRQLFKRFATYNGSNPYKAPATLNVIAHVELSMGGFYVRGGMYTIARAMEKLAIKLGVTIHLNSVVEGIISADKVRQIKSLKINGTAVQFDTIISNCDATITHTELTTNDQINLPKKNQLSAIEPSCSGFVILLGVNKKYSHLKHHNIFFSDNYKDEFDELFKRKKASDNPTIYIANTSVHSPEDVPDESKSNLFILVNTPYLNKNEGEWDSKRVTEYGDLIIDLLERFGLSDLKNSIEERHHISPKDFYLKYMSNKGSIYGTSSNGKMAAFARPKNKSIYFDNLYLTGGSTHPGGGIPLAVLSAKHAHTLFNRDLDLETTHLIKMGKLSKYKSR
jgi:phytoene desaturase